MFTRMRLLLLVLPFLLLVGCIDPGEPVQADPNDIPMFTSSSDTSVVGYSVYTYDITAADADTDAVLTIGAEMLPSWLALTDSGDGTAVLTGIPGNDDIGEHQVVLTLTDGVVTAPVTQSFTVTVSFPPIIITGRDPTEPVPYFRDPLTIIGGYSRLDTLRLAVEYPGGCRQHEFLLVGAGFYLKSNPPGGQFFLNHDAKGDTCPETISQYLYFDLTPVREWCLILKETQLIVFLFDLNRWLSGESTGHEWLFRYQLGDTSTVILERVTW